MSDAFAPIGAVRANKPIPDKQTVWVALLPVPSDAPPPPDKHMKLGKPSARWAYKSAQGDVNYYALRFDGPDGKEFRPLGYFQHAITGAAEWRYELPPAPRPLLGLDGLAALPSASVIVCEGEKSAQACGQILPSMVAVTSPAGSKSASKADWSPLAGRTVIIWPDRDKPGQAYAQEVARLCMAAGSASVSIIIPPDGDADGWDAADAAAEGWTTQRAQDLINAASEFSLEVDEAAKIKKRPRRLRIPQRSSLIDIVKNAKLWMSTTGEPYATFTDGGIIKNARIASETFKSYISLLSYREKNDPPGMQALQEAILVLKARAAHEGIVEELWYRVGARNGHLYIDLCDDRWRCIEISKDGWKIISIDGLPFVRTAGMRPLCVPQKGGSINDIAKFVNVETNDFILIIGWIIGAFRDRGPYSILAINGQHGTGKTFFCRLLRSLIDPSMPKMQGPPKDEHALIVGAQNRWLQVYDNISKLKYDLSDAICRLATGGGFAVRALHTDKDENIFDGARPMLLNGIPRFAEAADLNSRVVIVELKTITDEMRKPGDELESEWERCLPGILGSICDGLSAAIKNLPDIKLSRASRMADFEKWVIAAETGLGWSKGTFSAAYDANRAEGVEILFENNHVACAVLKLTKTLNYAGKWKGTAEELLEELNKEIDDSTKQLEKWPKTTQGLGNALDRAGDMLRSKGIEFTRYRSKGERITEITWSINDDGY